MKLRKTPVYVFITFISLCLISCSSSENGNLNCGLYCDISDLPTIESFSGSKYEEYEIHFPTVESATYRCDGIETDIAPNDPRLLRLLNFLAYSEEKNLSTWQQGYLNENDVNSLLSCDDPVIEVLFFPNKTSSGNAHSNATKIIICGDSYLLFTPKSRNIDSSKTDSFTERWWPYGEMIIEKIVSNDLEEDMLSYDGWGTGYWIDIIEYAGF